MDVPPPSYEHYSERKESYLIPIQMPRRLSTFTTDVEQFDNEPLMQTNPRSDDEIVERKITEITQTVPPTVHESRRRIEQARIVQVNLCSNSVFNRPERNKRHSATVESQKHRKPPPPPHHDSSSPSLSPSQPSPPHVQHIWTASVEEFLNKSRLPGPPPPPQRPTLAPSGHDNHRACENISDKISPNNSFQDFCSSNSEQFFDSDSLHCDLEDSAVNLHDYTPHDVFTQTFPQHYYQDSSYTDLDCKTFLLAFFLSLFLSLII